MRIDDFVCLGRTVPEESKKYGHKVCMAGYSEELRALMRVYPLPVVNPIHARHVCSMELVRNPGDSRIESWKLPEHGRSILAVSEKPAPVEEIRHFLEARVSRSIAELNGRRDSLGVLEVAECRGLFVRRSCVTHPDQGLLFDALDDAFGARAIDVAPYLHFYDAAGSPHQLQMREWGCYEFLRKHRDKAADLWGNLRLNDGNPTLLVVGNMSSRRSVWLVIKTFKVAKERPMSFDFDGVMESAVV